MSLVVCNNLGNMREVAMMEDISSNKTYINFTDGKILSSS